VELEETAPMFEHEDDPTSPETGFVEENARRRHSHLSKRNNKAAQTGRGTLTHSGEVVTNSQDDEAQQDPTENVIHNAYSIYHEELQHSSGDIIHDPRKRKRHSKATENDESRSKKHKKRRTQVSQLTDFAGEEEDLDTIGAPVSRNYDLGVSPEKSLFGMNSGNQVLSKMERKELKRRRKEERQRKREENVERKKSKERAIGMESQDKDVDSDDHEIIVDDKIERTNEIPSTYEANYSTGGLSQEIPLNQDPAGKPSRKSRKQRDLEIAATQEHQSPVPRSTPRSSPEGTPLPEPKRRSLLSLNHNSTKKKTRQSTPTLALDRSSDVPIVQSNGSINDAEAYAAEPDIISAVEGDEEIEMTSAQTPEPSGNQNGHVVGLSSSQRSQNIPRGKRRRQVSAQRIYDSSADEEPPEPPPTSKERKRKVGDLVKHHKPDPTSAETDEEKEGVGHGEFTSEEDERLRKVVSQYRQVSLSPQNSPDT